MISAKEARALLTTVGQEANELIASSLTDIEKALREQAKSSDRMLVRIKGSEEVLNIVRKLLIAQLCDETLGFEVLNPKIRAVQLEDEEEGTDAVYELRFTLKWGM